MNRLKELRKEKGLTQQELANELNVSKLSILRWENGQRDIKVNTAQQLADFFGVSVGYLLGYNDFIKELDEVTTEFMQAMESKTKHDNVVSIAVKTEKEKEIFKKLALAPSEYISIISLWSLLTKKQKESILNLIESFDVNGSN